MPVTPHCVRVESAEDLEIALDAMLAPLLNAEIFGVEIDQSKEGPFFTRNLYCAFSSQPSTSALLTPFRFKTFSASDESEMISLVTQFIQAHPGYFFSGLFVVYRTQNPNPNQGVIGGIFYNTSASAAVNWGGSGGSVSTSVYDVQIFTLSGTWNKPAGAKLVTVTVSGTGGGGGSGRRGAAGSNRSGGVGGGCGGFLQREFQASDLGLTEDVVIGTPGVGGAAQTVDNTNGVAGTQGTDCWFGPSQALAKARASGGSGGPGGTTGSNNGAFGGQPLNGTNQSGGSSTGAGGSSQFGQYAGSGGGGGGGLDVANTPRNGGFGASVISAGSNFFGAQGIAPNGNGGDGPVQPTPYMPGPGGGGGASGPGAPGGRGGNGAAYSSGGGGGAASENGFASGRGGDGGPGVIIVISQG
jgi:hypothetical protein